ncbi:translation protein SH3-like domain-containing protein [Pelagophyceae sp. CCMP2097]|nr:translation protein SH3-like domain-containing protein [Pelagophyceae sp. CCMP2097]
MGDVEGFESTESGASACIPMEAGQIRKGGFIVIKDRPCKVVGVTTSKTGKHGHAKCHFVATDIFTGKKLEDLVPSTHGTTVPNVVRVEFTLIDINDEDYLSLMDEGGDIREDLKVPDYPDELAKAIREGFAAQDELILTVVSAMGEEHVMQCKKNTSEK